MDETTTETANTAVTESGPEPHSAGPETPHEEEQPGSSRILREWGFDVETFEKRARQSLDAARGDFAEIKGTLRQAASDTKQVLLDLQKTRGPVARELKNGFERAWDELERAFARARERMKESQQQGTSPASSPTASEPEEQNIPVS